MHEIAAQEKCISHSELSESKIKKNNFNIDFKWLIKNVIARIKIVLFSFFPFSVDLSRF